MACTTLEWTIRPAATGDAAAMRQCVHDAYSHYIDRMGQTPGPILDDYEAVVRREGSFVSVTPSGTVVGILVMIESATRMLLDNVAVAPGCQGQGLGAALLQLADQYTLERGFRELELYTHEKMTENIAMYGRAGFEETRRIEEKGFARVYMRKVLTPEAKQR